MSSYTGLKRLTTSMTFTKRFSLVIRFILALILIIFSVFPVLWIISSSINPSNSLASAKLIPDNWSFNNFYILLPSQGAAIREFSMNILGQDIFPHPPEGKFIFPFWKWWWNSIKIASISTILSLSITTTAAFAFSRFRFKGRQTMLKSILLIQVFPNLLALIAIFLMIAEVGDIIPFFGLDTHAGLILVYLGGSMGLNIWLLKGYLDTIPRDIDESAMVDGATSWQIFTNLILPLLRPILAVVGVLSFIGTYGDFVLARILLKTQENLTLMVGLQIFTSGQFSLKWGPFSVGALMGALPIMIIYLVLQDQIVGGLTQGAVKG
ncbi:MAG: maltose ABC transporter permease [Desulfuromonadales bacterium C00003093]|nr:MAG: maltose ABC transporter permease [Desulfuromonadales bacterium C00003093]